MALARSVVHKVLFYLFTKEHSMPIQTLADIQNQLAQQSGQIARQGAANMPTNSFAFMRPTGVGYGDTRTAQQIAQQNLGYAQQQAASNTQAQQDALRLQDPTQSPGAALNRIIGMGEDVYQGARSNPVDQMLMAELQKRVSGQNAPYNAETINAMKTGAANQSAAAEAANSQQAMQNLEARGFTPKDPAYQAALAANQAQRQQANQGANLQIAQNANLANYNAQGQAIGQANAVNRGQQAQQLAAGQFATQGLNQVSTQDLARQPSWQQLPTYSGYQQTQAKKTTPMQRPATQF